MNPYAPPAADLAVEPAADALAPYLGSLAYPLDLRFKVWSFAPRIELTDATGRTVLHVRQKLFRLREHVEIFTDASRSTRLAEIRANKVIDWSARYDFTDAWGGAIGCVARKGWRSIWRARYDVFNPGETAPEFVIREQNPLAKVLDALLGQVPLLGLLTLWLFHPRYLASRGDSGVLSLEKRPAFFEGRFRIEQVAACSTRETMNLILAFLMLTLLERRRG